MGEKSSSRDHATTSGSALEASGYTPGPWRYSRTMRLVGNGFAAPWVCQVEDQGVPRERFEANARLISTAPELRTALLDVLAIFGSRPDIWALIGPAEKATLDAAGAVIAKAAGIALSSAAQVAVTDPGMNSLPPPPTETR